MFQTSFLKCLSNISLKLWWLCKLNYFKVFFCIMRDDCVIVLSSLVE